MQIEEVGVGERVARAIHSVCIILPGSVPALVEGNHPSTTPYFVVACGICSFKNFHCKKKIDNLILESPYGYPHNLAQCLAH